ncbi:uncharacterized protein [Typha latifolia]|uniref:uncharacterized protein n=1 Tax=Typha latifolia TaxID=4733 RepID=UPI003C2D7A02
MGNLLSSENTTVPQLSNDDIFEILAHLPPASIAKCKLINKSISHFLTSDKFFHLAQANYTNADSGIFVLYYDDFDLLPLDKHALMPHEALEFLSDSATILGSDNGLVFYKNKNTSPGRRLCVYNPARRSWWSIASPPGDDIFSVPRSSIAVKFYGGNSPDYKLVYLSPSSNWGSECHCRVYDTAAKTWCIDKMIEVGNRNIQFEHPVVCGNTVFWASSCGIYMNQDPYIIAFDIETERSEMITLPSEAVKGSADGYEIRIAKWRGKHLCLLHYDKLKQLFTLWLMTINKMTPLWRRMHGVSIGEVGIEGEVNVEEFILFNSYTIVFNVDRCLYKYNLINGALEKVKKIKSWMPTLIPYASTMRPCGRFEGIEIKI